MQRTPRLRLGSMSGVIGAGSLIRSVRRHDAHVKETQNHSCFGDLRCRLSCRGRRMGDSCALRVGLWKLQSPLNADSRGHTKLGIRTPKDHERRAHLGGHSSLFTLRESGTRGSRLSAGRHIYHKTNQRSTEVFHRWSGTFNMRTPNNWLQARPGCAFLFVLALRPGLPEQNRWATV